jgi:hypothetical protein
VITLGTPLLREIDKGLARSRVGIELVEKSGLLGRTITYTMTTIGCKKWTVWETD